MTLLSIILAIVLNLIPANVTSFTVDGRDERETLRCTKQAGGDWIRINEARRDRVVAFRVNGTKLGLSTYSHWNSVCECLVRLGEACRPRRDETRLEKPNFKFLKEPARQSAREERPHCRRIKLLKT